MEKQEPTFSPEESLRVISTMIERTRHTVGDSSHYFLLWGWAVFIGSLLQYYLKVIAEYPHHYYAWLITPVALLVHILFLLRDKRRVRVKTFIGEASEYLWTAIGFSFLVFAFIFAKIGWQYCYPFYILLYAVGTFVSGRLIRFTPLVAGSIICFPLAAFTATAGENQQILLLAAAILVSYIIPGHLLQIQYKSQRN